MTSTYTRRTPIDSTPAPCCPERLKAICLTCTRWRSAAPIPYQGVADAMAEQWGAESQE